MCAQALLLLLGAPALAEPTAQPATPEPAAVYVGMYINRIYDVSLRDSSFNADLWVWFRWKGHEVDPLVTFEVVNGEIESKSDEYRDEIPGYHYGACRVVARVTKLWDTSPFPLDSHTIAISVEDSDSEESELKYLPDSENSALDPEVRVPGWTIASHWAEVTSHRYNTNYGDISLPTGNQSVYSRFSYSLHLARRGYGVFLKTFFGLFISALIALLALFIKPTDLDPRFGLGIGAIFAAVASEYVVVSTLPESNSLTMADQLHMLAFGIIFLTLGESTLALYLWNQGKEEASKRLDKISVIALSIAYGVTTIIVLLQPWR